MDINYFYPQLPLTPHDAALNQHNPAIIGDNNDSTLTWHLLQPAWMHYEMLLHTSHALGISGITTNIHCRSKGHINGNTEGLQEVEEEEGTAGPVLDIGSLMDLQQVHPAPPFSAIPFPSSSPFYFHHISDTPPFVPVPLVFILCPCIPVSLISVPMSPWSSHPSHIVLLPHSCFPCFTLVPLFLVPD